MNPRATDRVPDPARLAAEPSIHAGATAGRNLLVVMTLGLALTLGGCDSPSSGGAVWGTPPLPPPSKVDDAWAGWTPGEEPTSEGLEVEAPPVEIEKPLDPSELVKEALQECAELVVQQQTEMISGCQPSSMHAGVISWAVEAANQQVQQDPRLAGLDWPAVYTPTATSSFGDQTIDVYACGTMTGQSGLNALAMPETVYMLDPMMSAMAEAAVWYAAVVEQHGLPLSGTAKKELTEGIWAIFVQAQDGAHWKLVPEPEVAERLQSSSLARESYAGAVSFVVFHELGHANLSHGLIKCALQKGVKALFTRRGIEPSEEELKKVVAEIYALERQTEAQSDIYALTMLKSLGFGKQGPQIFAVGVMGIRLDQCLKAGKPESELQACALTAYDLTTTHPPIGERLALIEKVFDMNEDLTSLLVPTAFGQTRAKECGNGVCEPTESTLTCAQDCSTANPTCGDGACNGSESKQTCSQDCGTPSAYCGDGSCNGSESQQTCSEDCGTPSPYCGDGSCNGSESKQTCSQDCGTPSAYCGDGLCNGSESPQTCSTDCGVPSSYCGDGECDFDETPDTCSADCGLPGSYCGDGVCDFDETSETCSFDCEAEPGSCYGACGVQSPDGCYCDAECDSQGDCCPDKSFWCE